MRLNPKIFAALLYIALSAGLGLFLLLLIRVATRCLGTARASRGKYEPYECGVPLLGSARERFQVKFFLVALLFVLFDIETVFLLPYAVAYRHLGLEGFFGVLAFVAVLAVGLLYILKRQALEFE